VLRFEIRTYSTNWRCMPLASRGGGGCPRIRSVGDRAGIAVLEYRRGLSVRCTSCRYTASTFLHLLLHLCAAPSKLKVSTT
jgi:hypothetical protein